MKLGIVMKVVWLMCLLIGIPGYVLGQTENRLPTQQSTMKPAVMSDLELLQKDHAIKHMWALSKNFQYGMTVSADPAKAFAWFALYAASLPKDYPGVSFFLDKLRKPLTKQQLKQGYYYYHKFRNQYNLNFRLSEAELSQIFDLEKKPAPVSVKNIQAKIPDFVSLLAQLRESNQNDLAVLLAEKMQDAQATIVANPQGHIVYGRVHVLGAWIPQMVLSKVKVLRKGYFVGVVPATDQKISFVLSGYRSVERQIPQDAKRIVNFGLINMHPLAKGEQAEIIGRIIASHAALSTGNVFLQIMPSAKSNDVNTTRDPWYIPTVPLTVLPSGQFYANDLSPANYQLVVQVPGHKKKIEIFHLDKGEKKQLPIIQLSNESRPKASTAS